MAGLLALPRPAKSLQNGDFSFSGFFFCTNQQPPQRSGAVSDPILGWVAMAVDLSEGSSIPGHFLQTNHIKYAYCFCEAVSLIQYLRIYEV